MASKNTVWDVEYTAPGESFPYLVTHDDHDEALRDAAALRKRGCTGVTASIREELSHTDDEAR